MYFQSYSALALIKVNSGWFHVSERGVFSRHLRLDDPERPRARLRAHRRPLLVVALPWQWVFFMPAVIMALMGLSPTSVVRDSPEEAGLPPFDTAGRHQRRHREGRPHVRAREGLHQPGRRSPSRRPSSAPASCATASSSGSRATCRRRSTCTLDSPVFQKGRHGRGRRRHRGRLRRRATSPTGSSSRAARRWPSSATCCRWPASRWSGGRPASTAVIAAFVVNSFAISMVHSMLSGTASMDFGGKKRRRHGRRHVRRHAVHGRRRRGRRAWAGCSTPSAGASGARA